MKSRIIPCLTAVFSRVVSSSAGAERPSVDRLAIETGISKWVSAWNPRTAPFNAAKLAPLFRPDVVTNSNLGKKTSWVDYLADLQAYTAQFVRITAGPAEDLRVRSEGARAFTSFLIRPETISIDGRHESTSARIHFVWEKTNAVWRMPLREAGANSLGRASHTSQIKNSKHRKNYETVI
jgi:hypothetical protein